MEPTTIAAIATGVVSLLTPTVTRIGESLKEPAQAAMSELAKTIGQKAGGQVGELFEFVAKKFRNNPAAETSLKDYVEMPDDEDAQAAFRKELKKAMRRDEGFAEQLGALLETAKTSLGSSETHISGPTIGAPGGITIGGSGHKIDGGLHIGSTEGD